MTDFAWNYVTRTATDALSELGRTVAATICEAVDPGIYLVEPDIVYEVRSEKGGRVVLRNGDYLIGGPAEPDAALFAHVAAELAGVATRVEVVRSSVELVVAV